MNTVTVKCPNCEKFFETSYTLPYDFSRCPYCGQGSTGLAYKQGNQYQGMANNPHQ